MMADIIHVKVVAGARRNEVKEERTALKVYVTAPAIEGKANKAVLELLAEYFGCKKSQVRIIKGERSKDKSVQIQHIS
jgi:hypothetical protein